MAGSLPGTPLAGLGFILALLVSVGATRLVLGHLLRKAVLDIPNDRSSHSVPTPRGGGWGVIAGLAVAGVLIASVAGPALWLGFLALALVVAVPLSWRDDRGGLGVRIRLLGQFLSVSAAIAGVFMTDAPLADTILGHDLSRTPLALVGLAILMTGYVWFVNLYNFMDGIDGIAGAETVFIAGSIAAIAWLSGLESPLLFHFPLILAGAAAGFLVWNWHPAKVFMGDVGSIPLGLTVGFFLLSAALSGLLFPAIILPLYFVADATLTLFRRLARGEKVWEAHRTHFYQRAATGVGHSKTVLVIMAGNAGLFAFAVLALTYPFLSLVAALAWTASLLGVLSVLAGDTALRQQS